MFERLRDIFHGGISTRYSTEGVILRHPFYTIAAGRDKKTMRPVLIKTYTDEGMDVQLKLDANYRERTLAEALPELANRFVAKTIETGKIGGKRVEVLEAAPTRALRECFEQKTLSNKAFKRAILEVCEGVAYLHSRGLVHRGLSPDAITVTDAGDAKIIDLSLVMDASKMHASGTMVGPLGYVAPEIIRRGAVDARCDIYSLGAICYEMFSGALPFPRGVGYEGLIKMINGRPVPLSERNDEVPPELERVVMKAIAKRPEDRYQTAEEMAVALSAVPLPETRRERTPASAAA